MSIYTSLWNENRVTTLYNQCFDNNLEITYKNKTHETCKYFYSNSWGHTTMLEGSLSKLEIGRRHSHVLPTLCRKM